jgi:hypothetical protein
MNINTLEEEQVKGDDEKIKVGKEDEVLSQLTIHTLEEVSTNTFEKSWLRARSFKTEWPGKLHWCLKCNLALMILLCILLLLLFALFSLVDI